MRHLGVWGFHDVNAFTGETVLCAQGGDTSSWPDLWSSEYFELPGTPAHPDHIRMCLLEVGAYELARYATMNRGGYPAVLWCWRDTPPTHEEVRLVLKAMHIWYATFALDRLLQIPAMDRVSLSGLHDDCFEYWCQHRLESRVCRHCSGLPQLDLEVLVDNERAT